jgi:hypothetical protein
MKDDRTHAGSVSRLRANARPKARSSRRIVRRVLLAGIILAGVAAFLAPTRPMRGFCLTAVIMIFVGEAIEWLVATGGQLSGSERKMDDDWQTQWYGPPPP